ncbi:MAG: hypothetical protein LBQ10_06370 [Desulfovibrio sp.]|nr:hypothetical protein [Desulfovibrio sp.]
MFFLYSRKPQFLLLLCWCLGLAAISAYAIGGDVWDFGKGSGKTEQVRANLGEQPAAPSPEPTQPPADPPPEPERPTADPRLNRLLALRVLPNADGDEKKLVLEADYTAALANGFTPDKARGYYFLEGAPTVVVALGHPWVTDVEQKKFSVDMPQVRDVRLVRIEPQNLRLFVTTHTALQASSAKVRIEPTPTGLRAEIHFTR